MVLSHVLICSSYGQLSIGETLAGTHKIKNRSELLARQSVLAVKKVVVQPVMVTANQIFLLVVVRRTARLCAAMRLTYAKKVRALALKNALSSKANAGQLIVLENAELKEGNPSSAHKLSQAGD